MVRPGHGPGLEHRAAGGPPGPRSTAGPAWSGGGTLAGVLLPEIDQLVVKLAPLTIGAGIPLFGREAVFQPQAWELTEHVVLKSGALVLTYQRAG